MLGHTLRAECERIASTGCWDVFCLRCHTSVGTFTSRGLWRAIHNTSHRGGILCPDCRANSCRDCGVELDTEDKAFSELWPDIYKPYCWCCALDRETEERELEKDIPCLVPHNSKKGPNECQPWYGSIWQYIEPLSRDEEVQDE